MSRTTFWSRWIGIWFKLYFVEGELTMSNIQKILLGVGLVACVATTAYVVTKKSRKYTVLDGQEEKKEDHNVIERIKEAAAKKAIDILAFIAKHQQQVEAASTVIGIVAAVFSLISAIKDYKRSDDINRKLDDILNRVCEMEIYLENT